MTDLWVRILVIGLIVVCLTVMVLSAIRFFRQRAARRRDRNIVECRMASSVSSRSATTYGVRSVTSKSPPGTVPSGMSRESKSRPYTSSV